MKLNYPEMLQNIKMSIFTGEHSAVYSLACAIACIAAMVSLLWWYNKMLNDPYGRLDVRSIVRTGIVLFLTCNFYSFVLVPFDSVTHLVAKAITASVDKDKSGLMGKINDALSESEKKNREESLTGQLEEEMSGNLTTTADESGASGESSYVLESLAEDKIAGREKTGFFKRMWEGIKMAVSMKVGDTVNQVSTIISWLMSVAVKIVQWILLAVSSIYLIILGFIGPFVFAFSLIPGFRDNISTWLARYIQISFWVPMAAVVDFVNFHVKDALIAEFWRAGFGARMAFPIHMILIDAVLLITLLAIPTLSSWVVVSAGASEVNSSIASTASKAFMLKGFKK